MNRLILLPLLLVTLGLSGPPLPPPLKTTKKTLQSPKALSLSSGVQMRKPTPSIALPVGVQVSWPDVAADYVILSSVDDSTVNPATALTTPTTDRHFSFPIETQRFFSVSSLHVYTNVTVYWTPVTNVAIDRYVVSYGDSPGVYTNTVTTSTAVTNCDSITLFGLCNGIGMSASNVCSATIDRVPFGARLYYTVTAVGINAISSTSDECWFQLALPPTPVMIPRRIDFVY